MALPGDKAVGMQKPGVGLGTTMQALGMKGRMTLGQGKRDQRRQGKDRRDQTAGDPSSCCLNEVGRVVASEASMAAAVAEQAVAWGPAWGVRCAFAG